MAEKKYSYTYKYRGVDYKSPTTMIIGVAGIALVGAFTYLNWNTVSQAFQGLLKSIPQL